MTNIHCMTCNSRVALTQERGYQVVLRCNRCRVYPRHKKRRKNRT